MFWDIIAQLVLVLSFLPKLTTTNYLGTLLGLYCTEVIIFNGRLISVTAVCFASHFVLTTHPFLIKSEYAQRHFFFLNRMIC